MIAFLLIKRNEGNSRLFKRTKLKVRYQGWRTITEDLKETLSIFY